MKPYPKYKDSGVEWIGEVPEEWEIEKVSHAFSTIGSGTTPIAGNPEYHNEGTTPWINTGDLNNGILKTCSKKITNIAFNDYSALKIYPIGSLIIAMYGATIGKVSILDFTACTNQACCVLSESKKWNVKYVFYWFIANKEHIVSMSYGGGQPNISQEIIKSLRIPLPERNEQYAIIAYLNHKTAQIDNLISKKQKLIELLKEKRAATINQVVTKGLNPDAPMKDSGIECLGEIPAHWEVKRLKYVTKTVQTGTTPSSLKPEYFIDGEIDWFTPVDFRDSLFLSNSNRKLNRLAIDDNVVKLYGSNTVLLVGIGATLGKVGIIKRTASSNQQINAISFKDNYNPDFGAYYFQAISDIIVSMSNAATLPILNQTQTKEIMVPVPSQKEQDEIVGFINQTTTKIDQTISKIEKQIDLLKEYRTALISNVVTGKIDVRT